AALNDGDIIEADELSVYVMHTPGHTLGGVCYITGDVIFSGDTLFCGDVGRCDLYGGSYPTMKRSLAKLCELEGDYAVYPGHGQSTTLEYERKNNRYILEPMPAE
ncbi:MAG: MBL fold metallo-hydrolase, partial [Oscillospiraceae bacterium]|nr:MBL fold metallo-hydrolase [Oscillospiraceae bacterium]